MGNQCVRSVEPLRTYEVRTVSAFVEYKAAGCVFTNGVVILGGHHRDKNSISGIGGKKNYMDMDYVDTAWRETLEEIFGWVVSRELLEHVRNHMPPGKEIYYPTYKYVALCYTFDDLQYLLKILAAFPELPPTEFYERLPTHVGDIFLLRHNPRSYFEIKQLCLLPVEKNIGISTEFREDIKRLRI